MCGRFDGLLTLSGEQAQTDRVHFGKFVISNAERSLIAKCSATLANGRSRPSTR
ncbi:MAG: hypothetical protein N838_19805 [Thiohalocapsa sp. PB-PSB1]|jgi:hypothetical protein|nr:MAG: hypothetical protein N838_19805 [Thiohalocapsa sp. PB-PSB1]